MGSWMVSSVGTSACYFHPHNTPALQLVSLLRVTKIIMNLDLRVQLSASEYGDAFKDDTLVTVTSICDKLLQTYVSQFKYLKENSTGELTHLLDLVMHGHMIDNVVLVLGGAVRNKDAEDLVKSCHPLGRFEVLVYNQI